MRIKSNITKITTCIHPNVGNRIEYLYNNLLYYLFRISRQNQLIDNSPTDDLSALWRNFAFFATSH